MPNPLFADTKYVSPAGPLTQLGFEPEDIELFGSYVLVQRDEHEQMTAGGLHLPDRAKELKHSGTVLSVGPDVLNDKLEGRRVLFGKYTGIELTLNDTRVVILDESNLICAIAEGVKSDRVD